MYQHHKDSIERLKDYLIPQGVIAIVLDGSIVRGEERIDSDVDALVVISDEDYEKRKREGRLAEVVKGYCTYENGYFDLKYKNKSALVLAARYGSEPTRNALLGARTIYTTDEEIPSLIERIASFPVEERKKKLDVFYANLAYQKGYFIGLLKEDDVYMKLHTASELIYSVYRMILEENGILFPCNRGLESFVARCQNKPDGILELAKEFAENICQRTCDAFVDAFMNWTSYRPHENFAEVMTDYVKYYEEWWMEERMPFVNEW